VLCLLLDIKLIHNYDGNGEIKYIYDKLRYEEKKRLLNNKMIEFLDVQFEENSWKNHYIYISKT
jgi:hypothetical protein